MVTPTGIRQRGRLSRSSILRTSLNEAYIINCSLAAKSVLVQSVFLESASDNMVNKKAVIISTSQATYPNSNDKTGVW